MNTPQDEKHSVLHNVAYACAVALALVLWVIIMTEPKLDTYPVKAESPPALNLGLRDVEWQPGTALNLTQAGSVSFAVYKTHNITFMCRDGSVTVNGRTGSVTLSYGLELDEAAKGFWEAVERAYPGFVQKKQDGN